MQRILWGGRGSGGLTQLLQVDIEVLNIIKISAERETFTEGA